MGTFTRCAARCVPLSPRAHLRVFIVSNQYVLFSRNYTTSVRAKMLKMKSCSYKVLGIEPRTLGFRRESGHRQLWVHTDKEVELKVLSLSLTTCFKASSNSRPRKKNLSCLVHIVANGNTKRIKLLMLRTTAST